MRIFLLSIFSLFFTTLSAQEERDTVLSRCPVYITDTVSLNNFFLEFQPATVRVTRNKGKLQVQVQQRDQFFTLFFRDRKLKEEKYKIVTNDIGKDEVMAKYSFRSGSSASFVDITQGTVEASFDEEKDLWHVQVKGMLSNKSATSVTYYRVRADFYIH